MDIKEEVLKAAVTPFLIGHLLNTILVTKHIKIIIHQVITQGIILTHQVAIRIVLRVEDLTMHPGGVLMVPHQLIDHLVGLLVADLVEENSS
tara:strand:- start:271 stop:546 length:276 start_codon:yes stop_codon:yes gene_type:complete